MRPSTKQTITAVGVAVGATAVASIGNYLTTRYLVKIALDHEKPRMVEKTERVIEKTGRSIAGSEKNEAFLEELRAASERLAARENETVEIIAHDGEKLVGHWIQAQNPKRIIIAMHGWRGSWHKDFGLVADAYLENGCSVLYAEQRGQNNSGGDYIGFGLTERYDCLDWALAANRQYGGKLPIYLCGVSMGATTVLMAARLDLPVNVRGIIADCG
ncbi:MAG: alpha/beta hydrolase, partial [Oscillospiraceae bacterium]|nr:alpha/beta hydrolase [Oscillospiraceae bacterium]